ncbi:hypothetical protein D3C72_1372450 [compost metagenome]
MVVIGVDAGGLPRFTVRRRCDADVVGAFLDGGTELAQFGGHGGQAVGLLHAPAGNIAQGGAAIGIQRHGRQGHGGIGNVVAVHVDGLQWPGAPANFQPVGAAGNGCSHGTRGIYKADVTLDRLGAHAQHLDAAVNVDGGVVGAGLAALARGDGAQRDEVAGRRGIGLHMDLAWRLIMAACGNGKALPAMIFDSNAEALEQLKRDVDVGLGDQLSHHFDGHILLARHQRKCHQQGCQELAGYIASHRNGRL